MTLPIRQLPTEDFVFGDGQTIKIRGLSRAEAIQLRGLSTDVVRLEILAIKFSCGVTEEEAEAWHNVTPNDDVERLVNDVARLSGMDEQEGKAGAEALPSAKLTELITSLQKISDALSMKSES